MNLNLGEIWMWTDGERQAYWMIIELPHRGLCIYDTWGNGYAGVTSPLSLDVQSAAKFWKRAA